MRARTSWTVVLLSIALAGGCLEDEELVLELDGLSGEEAAEPETNAANEANAEGDSRSVSSAELPRVHDDDDVLDLSGLVMSRRLGDDATAACGEGDEPADEPMEAIHDIVEPIASIFDAIDP